MNTVHRFLFFFLFSASLIVTSCHKEKSPQPDTDSFHTVYYTLGGQKWKLTQYHLDQSTNMVTDGDTIVFTDSTHLVWHGVSSTYTLYSSGNNTNTCTLQFNDSPFGAVAGFVPASFATYGQINGIPFSGGYPTRTYYMWFVKL